MNNSDHHGEEFVEIGNINLLKAARETKSGPSAIQLSCIKFVMDPSENGSQPKLNLNRNLDSNMN